MLPEKFERRMKELLGTEYEAFLAGFQKEHFAGLRLNRLKISGERWEKLSPFELAPIPWIENGYYFNPGKYGGQASGGTSPTKHPYYYAGLYYIQEPSAMTPAHLLPVEPGDRVLDLCAAPGGKSTELAAKLRGRGVLVSNDISNTRAKALLKNLGVFGVKNAVIMSEDPKNLQGVFHGFFDKILIDAPCSGEGMFRKDPAIRKNWEQYGVDYYNRIQKEIILYAADLLRPGGMLMYSTCTFSPEENEGTIAWLLDHRPEFSVEPIRNRYEGFAPGRPEWIGREKDSFHDCVRIWPHRMNGEGHFCALLRKGEDGPREGGLAADREIHVKRGTRRENAAYGRENGTCFVRLTDPETEFLHEVGFSEEELSRVELHGEKLYLIPEGLPDLGKLRILRNGLYLGDRKKNRFEPSQPLAMALQREQVPAFLDLSADSKEVVKYLKCETIELAETAPAAKNGRTTPAAGSEMVLIGTEGFPLGWGKRNGTTIKNKYFSGWRML